jgi:hypothetical protein
MKRSNCVAWNRGRQTNICNFDAEQGSLEKFP